MSEPTKSSDAMDAVTWPVRVAAAWTWRLLVIGLGLYVLWQGFLKIELVAFSFIIAMFFTAVLHPLEVVFRKLPGSRSLSSLLALLVGIAVLTGITWFVVWQISSHSSQLADQVNNFVTRTRDWLRTGPLHLKSSDLNKIADNITKAVKDNQGQLISGAIQTVRTVVEALGAILLILLSTFFLLRDGEQIWNWTVRLFPKQAHPKVDIAGRAGWKTLGGYIRGQVIIALFHGISVMIVLFVLRVPLAAALAVLIFLGSFIPLLGLTVAGALCVAVALLEHGVGAGIAVGIAIVVLFQLEAHLLQPLIMSRSVEVHPLAIALSVLSGTLVAGIVGALLAVPLVAFLNSTVHALRASPDPPTDDSGLPVERIDSPGGGPLDRADPADSSDGIPPSGTVAVDREHNTPPERGS
jgi:predicted PurR-regulated permease PerM